MSDLVAVWEVSLSDGLHLVEFEHGTTTGKRVIRVDGKVMVGHRAPSDAHPVATLFFCLLRCLVLVNSC